MYYKNKMKALPFLLTVVMMAMMIVPITVVAAEPPVELGDAAIFAVLAGSTVTNTGTTVISGEVGGHVGVSPGTSITGILAGDLLDGSLHTNDQLAIDAQIALTAAYIDASTRTPEIGTSVTDLSTIDLGTQTLTPGIYSFSSSAQLTGTLTLDGEGDPNAAFIFRIGSTLTTADYSTIELINDAVFCRIFWQVGSSATLGIGSEFVGHIMAQDSITANTDATVQGQLLARTGAVTLDSNTITNGFCTTTLHVIKNVINDDGGTAVASDFDVHVMTSLSDVIGSPVSGAESPGTTYMLAPGTYIVSEGSFEGYTASFSGDSDVDGVVTLVAGDEKTVTLTNNDIPTTATLNVIKHVVNDSGRTAVASDFNVHVTISSVDVTGSPASGAESPGTTYTLDPGTYNVREDAYEGYVAVYSGDSDASGNITLAAGDVKTVTITNNDIPTAPVSTVAYLRVIKHVINDNGRTAVASDFNVHVKTIYGIDVSRSPLSGAESPGTLYVLAPGTYIVSEGAYEGYTTSYSGDSDASGNITLTAGNVRTVTITNNDIPITPTPTTATLHVIKYVVNDDGRTEVASDFNVHVKTSSGSDVSGSPVFGAESPGTTYTLAPGTYIVSEDDYPHYTVSYSGDSNFSGSITLVAGDEKTITIINNDIPINPQTGYFFGGDSWMSISAAIAGMLLMLLGIYLYLRNQRRESTLR